MMRLFILMTSLAFLAACTMSGQKSNSNGASGPSGLKSVEFDYMNTAVSPADDFYEFANGAWLKNNPVPETETRWGSFNEVQENNNKIIHEILTEASKKPEKKGTTNQLLGDFYTSILNKEKRNSLGYTPIKPLLASIEAIQSGKDLAHVLAQLHMHGFDAFFGIQVEQDLKINTKNALYIGQSGLGLPGKDYYTKTEAFYEDLRSKYQTYAKELQNLYGQEHDNAYFNIELILAKASMDATELRDIAAQYNKLPYLEFKKTHLNFDWDHYLKTINVKAPDSIIVGQPNFTNQFNQLITENRMPQIRAYLKWAVMNQTASLLTEEAEQMSFEFYGKAIRGQKQMKASDKKAIDIINKSALAEALGKAFVEKAFSEEAKAKVYKMVDDLMVAFESRIKQLVWMSDDTKKEAQRKLASFTRKLGFPENWTDYSSLSIDKDDYFSNVMNCHKFEFNKNLAKLYKPIDKLKWEMPPHIVNAYYNPLLNEIVFPAGILQPPFFDARAEDAVNYARMGAVIGHELTHGFDDQGAQFTAEGLFKNWWNEDDFMQFQLRTAKLVNQYNSFQPVPGVFVNGKLTLGENIADFGGLTIAYHAYMNTLKGKKMVKINNYTPEQRFFIAFAQIWKSNTTEKALRHQVDTDPHSPAKYRVNGSLANMPEFFNAFNIPKNNPMRLPDSDIAIIW